MDPVDRIRGALSGERRRSALYRWLWENYALISDQKKPGVRVDWITIADALADLGVKTRFGQKFRPDTVRRVAALVAVDAKKAGWTGRRTARGAMPQAETTVATPRERLKLTLRPPRPRQEDK